MYWKRKRGELLAMLSSQSLPVTVPTWFITFSPADSYWPELFKAIDSSLTDETFNELSSAQRAKLLAENSDLAAQHFHARWSSFFKNIQNSPQFIFLFILFVFNFFEF